MKKAYLLLLASIAALPLSAREVQGAAKTGETTGSMKTVEELCQPSKAQSDLSINNVRATILGGGDMGFEHRSLRGRRVQANTRCS